MTADDRVVVFRSEDKEWRWRRVAANGEIISTSGESYTLRWSAKRAAKRANPDATKVMVL